MQIYDKIYVPAEGKSQTDYYMDREGDLIGLTELSGQIVLTVEELREVFKAGYNRSGDEWDGSFNQHAVNQPDFETYIQSKGIQL